MRYIIQNLRQKRITNKKRKYNKYSYIPVELLDNTLNYSDVRLMLYILKQFLKDDKNIMTLSFNCIKYFEYFNLNSNSRHDQLKNNIEKINNSDILKITLSDYNSVINVTIKNKLYNDIYNKDNCFKIKCSMDDLLQLNNYKLLSILYATSINNNSYTWNILDFKKYLNIQNKYSKFADLRKVILNTLIEEGNKIGYSIKYQTIKLGNSINEIKFTIED